MEIKFNSLQQATIGVSGSDITYECTGNATFLETSSIHLKEVTLQRKVMEHILRLSALSEMDK